MKSLQKFASIQDYFHSSFNLESHLVSRQEYEARRPAALAEWQLLMV